MEPPQNTKNCVIAKNLSVTPNNEIIRVKVTFEGLFVPSKFILGDFVIFAEKKKAPEATNKMAATQLSSCVPNNRFAKVNLKTT